MSGAALNGIGQNGYPASGGGGSGPSEAWRIGNLAVRDNTVGLWLLSGDLSDSSGNGNDFAVNAAGTAPSDPWNDGWGTVWRYFDGNYSLDAGSPADFDILGDVTLSFTQWSFMEIAAAGVEYLFGKVNAISGAAVDNTNYLVYLDRAVSPARWRWFTESGVSVDDNTTIPQPGPNYYLGQVVHYAFRRTTSSKLIEQFVQGRKASQANYNTDPTSGADSKLYFGGEATQAYVTGRCYRNVRLDAEAVSDADLLEDADQVMDGRFS